MKLKKVIEYINLSLPLGINLLMAFLFYKILKEENIMAVVYCSLIVKGKKKFSDVPDRLKDQVRQILIDIDCEYLIDEE